MSDGSDSGSYSGIGSDIDSGSYMDGDSGSGSRILVEVNSGRRFVCRYATGSILYEIFLIRRRRIIFGLLSRDLP